MYHPPLEAGLPFTSTSLLVYYHFSSCFAYMNDIRNISNSWLLRCLVINIGVLTLT